MGNALGSEKKPKSEVRYYAFVTPQTFKKKLHWTIDNNPKEPVIASLGRSKCLNLQILLYSLQTTNSMIKRPLAGSPN